VKIGDPSVDLWEDHAVLADNYEWLSKLRVIPFLRDVGKHLPLGAMIAKESVRSRMMGSDEGMSFTEFSYQVLQAYDFMALHERHSCTVQLGRTDQWGNITAGVELFRRVRGAAVYGRTLPLVTKTDGTKFGKTEGGTIWLDASKTSPYEMYQFWLNTSDDGVAKYLKYFTFLDRDEVEALEIATRAAPEQREAQRVLAREVTALVHGAPVVNEADAMSRALSSGDLGSLTEMHLDRVCRATPTTALARGEIERLGVVEFLGRVGVATSKREARELLTSGAIPINGRRVTGANAVLSGEFVLFGRLIIVRKGKKSYRAATLA
jgi:tyrosyl-tRNA synthetase